MSSFEQVCKYMNGVTPEMITKKEIVSTIISWKEIVVETVSTVSTSFFDEVVYRQYLKEATMLFSRKRV